MKKISKLLLALSFVLSVTTSAFAVTVVSWGGAYTESQKLGFGDPTAATLGIPVNWVDYTGGLSEIKMDNNHKGKIQEVIYHGDHTRLRVDLLGNNQFILKVPNSSNRMDIKEGREINIGWNSVDCRALDPK